MRRTFKRLRGQNMSNLLASVFLVIICVLGVIQFKYYFDTTRSKLLIELKEKKELIDRLRKDLTHYQKTRASFVYTYQQLQQVERDNSSLIDKLKESTKTIETLGVDLFNEQERNKAILKQLEEYRKNDYTNGQIK